MNTEFPPTPGTIYLNAAATGPLPVRAVEALAEFNGRRARPWTISLEEMFGALATSRERCARLINASASEIALTPNTSTGLHIAARVLKVPKGKVVLGHDGEFPANVYPWMALERTEGVPYVRIPLRDGLPDHDALIARIRRGDVGLVAVSWVSFVSGDRADLRRIGEACREHGAWFVVDAMQGIGAVQLDVAQCHIDILSCGVQKWLLAPWGIAFAYVRCDLLPQLNPETGGWMSVRNGEDLSRLLDYDLTYADDARRFEVATVAYQESVGLNASLGVILEAGLDNIEWQVRAITTQLMDGIAAMPHLTLLTPREWERRAGIVSCVTPEPEPVVTRLAAAGVQYSVRGGGVLRFSPHFYNTVEEIEATLEALHG